MSETNQAWERYFLARTTKQIMNYELCKQLKEAGLPQTSSEPMRVRFFTEKDYPKEPTLEELIDWCGEKFLCLELQCPSEGKWIAQTKTHECDCKRCKKILKENPEYLAINWEIGEGKSPKEAVAKLGLELHKEV